MSLDGATARPTASVPGLSTAKLKLDEPASRSIVAIFNDQRIVVRSWPLRKPVVFGFHE
jgi:hypothetical protein